MSIETEIDRLYQLPPGEFTAARNALAKRAGGDAPRVRQLTKPPLAAWAVNQLYWSDRKAYDTLIEAAETLRATHKAVLGGRRGDLRGAGREHEAAVERALKATLAILAESGHPVTDATRQAVAQTLRALPSAEPPGRLSRSLQPGGFEMLAGITVSRGARATPPTAKEAKPQNERAAKPTAADTRADKEKQKEKEAREEATAASRELRAAEHSAQRAEFESARATRAAARAEEELAAARQNLADARTRLEQADAAAEKAKRQLTAAERGAADASREVAAARRRAHTAQERLDRLSRR
jgi:hypothetical protein